MKRAIFYMNILLQICIIILAMYYHSVGKYPIMFIWIAFDLMLMLHLVYLRRRL